jgi:hypothetical protein
MFHKLSVTTTILIVMILIIIRTVIIMIIIINICDVIPPQIMEICLPNSEVIEKIYN